MRMGEAVSRRISTVRGDGNDTALGRETVDIFVGCCSSAANFEISLGGGFKDGDLIADEPTEPLRTDSVGSTSSSIVGRLDCCVYGSLLRHLLRRCLRRRLLQQDKLKMQLANNKVVTSR